ncbi:MAG: HAD hydrolase-like protein [Bacteroidia bacterium]|nr:HAD hydrolase-like protein [Bacteroidia bacterium]
MDTFREVNYALWQSYNRGEMDQATLRASRFQIVLERLGAVPDLILNQALAESYTHLAPHGKHLMPYAREILNYLQDKYTLHILSNGFADVQAIKLKSSGIYNYFKHIFCATSNGCRKPENKCLTGPFNR